MYCRWFYSPKCFISNIGETLRWIKHCWQRAFRGWADGDWFTDTLDVSEFTPGMPLGAGEHTLYVQAGDDALPEPNWSTSASLTIHIYIWTDLGYASTGNAPWIRIAIDPSDNNPVALFKDVDNVYRAHVMKWDTGTTWTDLGYASTGGTDYISIAIGSDNNPVVVFSDAVSVPTAGRAHGMKVFY